MKKISLIIFVILLTFSCGSKEADLTVKATIKGLKKGTVYLKKAEDTTIVTVDSVSVNGNAEIELHSNLESPEVFFL